LASADLLVIPRSGEALLGQFDLPKQLRTSSLVQGFQSPFLTQDIMEATDRFTELQRRGFIDRLSEGAVREARRQAMAGQGVILPAATMGSVSFMEGAGFQSRLNAFSHLLCTPIEGKKHRITISQCVPPPPPSGTDPKRKFSKFKEKDKTKSAKR
jgi:hypothetical protein